MHKPDNQGDYVVLVHGFWKLPLSMAKISRSLARQGYQTTVVEYVSRTATVANISHDLAQIVKDKCPDASKKVHFVTHSLGGLIVRYFLAHNKLANLGRVVMLAPPHQGSPWADLLSKFDLVNFIAGPALKELTTNPDGLPHTLPKPSYELGIIAAKQDEKVSLESAKLEGMKDFLLVSGTHGSILLSSKVSKAVAKFLAEGKF